MPVPVRPVVRTNAWLNSRLSYLWSNFFADVEEVNPVVISFGQYSKYRLGSIKLEPKTKRSLITITGMFKNPKIPTEVVDHTIAHELCHYAHGFSSLKPRLHKYPHTGGIVKKELLRRRLGVLVHYYHRWVRVYRQQLAD